jgi:hypothetical protein
MNTVSSSENLMEIRVSPAVVVVVLVLVASILVGLYFMVIAKPPGAVSTEVIAPAGPGPDATMAPIEGGGGAAAAATADKPAADKPAAAKPTANKPDVPASAKPAAPASNKEPASGGTY